MPYCPGLALALLVVAVASPLAGMVVPVDVGPGSQYSPQIVTIQVGDTVTWTNKGGFHDVYADDGSYYNFTSSSAWAFSHVFNAAGTYGYYCTTHGSPGYGMHGTVVVENAPSGQPGTLRLSASSYAVDEGAGSATITAQRLDGSDGAVTVSYGSSGGTATAGQDFTAVSGTLFWGDGDSSSKEFHVPIVADSNAEPDEAVALVLGSPTGGAALDPTHATATLTIRDDDSAPGGPPAAPTSLQATAQSSSEVALTWADNSTNETGFRVERRTVRGTFTEVATAGANATGIVVSGLDASTFYLFRVRAAAGGASSSAYSNEASAATLGAIASCGAGNEVLCVNGSRFRVTVDWRIPDGTTGAGHAVPVPSAPDSGLFYFFAPANLEMLLKVLNACVEPFNHYWVFYSATTNVEFAVVVTDTQNGKVRSYFNPLNRTAPPVQDVEAFATCP